LDLNYQLSKNPEKIIIHIDSPGGSVYAGQEMAKAIEASTVPITCVVDGMAASMGLYILQACDYRTMTARSLLMAHGPSTQNASGTAADLAAESDLLLKLSRALAHHIVRRTVYTVDQYLAIIARGDFWIGCETALELGFVDEIIGLKPVN
jgi:ATP-dependent Clp protease protease subunit